jgi:antitoxin HigA-1
MTAAFDPVHPGEVLAEQLDALDMSAAAAARALGIPQSRLSQILNGHRSVTADTALRLSRWLGTDDEFWMNLQARYDLDTARDRQGDLIEATVKPLASSLA